MENETRTHCVWMLIRGEPPAIVGYDAVWSFQEACEVCTRLWTWNYRLPLPRRRIYYVVRPV